MAGRCRGCAARKLQAAANALTMDLVKDLIAKAAGGNIGEAASGGPR